ncbi:uncharacterized protein KY384_003453 [Bacidia gigantensis]|uniref:uncharacterized protein n=1 Tax=Bacidia gigantensis TaxID=2732470 RepID=UPI001D03DA96|nr:uncharacterized protein KY384_003453 [Bacidia gigantensis]KAG8531817.1 hypothetical protein KY384_003453 [Bacidia gigantensis]
MSFDWFALYRTRNVNTDVQEAIGSLKDDLTASDHKTIKSAYRNYKERVYISAFVGLGLGVYTAYRFRQRRWRAYHAALKTATDLLRHIKPYDKRNRPAVVIRPSYLGDLATYLALGGFGLDFGGEIGVTIADRRVGRIITEDVECTERITQSSKKAKVEVLRVVADLMKQEADMLEEQKEPGNVAVDEGVNSQRSQNHKEGAILPVRVEDYENDANGHKSTTGRSVTSRATVYKRLEGSHDEEKTGSDQAVEKILALVSKGAAIAENNAQLPFSEDWKLYVSDVPYDVSIREGDSILPKLENPAASAEQVLYQLASPRAGTAILQSSKQYTRPRNAVLVIVSVASHGQNRTKSIFRLASKCLGIAIFVVGTAIFASAQLLALPVAVTVLTLILAAGVGSRAINGWIVSGVSKTEPLIHVIVNTTQEAQQVIARILSIDRYDDQVLGEGKVRKIQVELGGHVFVNQRRVGSRSTLWLRGLGVLAEPFDLRRIDRSESFRTPMQESTDRSELEFGLLNSRSN